MDDTVNDSAIRVGSPVPQRLKEWFMNDRNHSEQWRKDAREDYDFLAGRQFSDEELQTLKKQKRPAVVFNRIRPVIDSVYGQEIGNRRQVRFIPREMGDAVANEMLTGAAEWFRDQAHAETHESDSFADMLSCGMGWTESRIDYEENPEGKPVVERVDPFEMFWDFNAKQSNISDARRVWRARKVPMSEAMALFPGKSRDDLDADWTTVTDVDDVARNAPVDEGSGDKSADTMVTLVHCQWYEREVRSYVATDPFTGQNATFSKEEYETTNDRLKTLFMPAMEGVPQKRKVVKQAFLGKVVLSYSDGPCPTHFSLQCITGKRDRNTGTWFGLVRSMKDPQRWANKWLSQMMFIMNSNSKGGLLAEKGAFEDQRKAEASWSDPAAITWLADGAIQNQRVKEKPPAQFPAGFQQLTEYAISSIRDTSGVSVEMLGLREAGQAASLEMQRRQAGMTILQPFFDSLKFYRERQGLVMLYYIQHDLSDGRLVKINGPDSEQYVPLIRQASEEYDIIVDDAPTSPNQKEAAWAVMMQLLPVMGQMIPPEMMVTMLEYSPLPSTIVEKLKKQAEELQASQSEQQHQQQAMMQEREGAEISKINSETHKNQVAAQVDAQEAQIQVPLQRMEMQVRNGELQIQQGEQQIAREQMQVDRERMATDRFKAAMAIRQAAMKPRAEGQRQN